LEQACVSPVSSEHDSVPFEPFQGAMTLDSETGEYRLAVRPERLPATFTLSAVKD